MGVAPLGTDLGAFVWNRADIEDIFDDWLDCFKDCIDI
jgi:hypothetical protein